MTLAQLNNLRLFIKVFITAWVPIVVLLFPDLFPSTISAVGVMGALTVTIDAFFRIFGVEETPIVGGD